MGTKQVQLDREREEHLAAVLKYDAACECLVEVESHAREIRDRWMSYQGVEQQFKQLLEEKNAIIASGEYPGSEQLHAIAQSIVDLDGQIKELGEAIDAGKQARKAMDRVQEHLSSASGWGTWDMLGRWRYSNVGKTLQA